MTTRTAVIMAFATLQANLADPVKADWQAAAEQGSPVDVICNSMEAMYAHMKATPADAEAVAPVLGQSAWLIMTYGFHGKADRAADIFQACRRALGETVDVADPDVDAKYVAAEPAA
jgi:L-ascorbate metabolism protein UlaG (beta-lactamase superfamily)